MSEEEKELKSGDGGKPAFEIGGSRRVVYIMQSVVRPDILMAVYDNEEAALFDQEFSKKQNMPMKIITRIVNT